MPFAVAQPQESTTAGNDRLRGLTSDGDAVTVEASPPRVLVVDDDPANRESLARRLGRRGFDVVMAEDGPSALVAMGLGADGSDAPSPTANPFDLVLLDVMMPGMSGLEVLTRVRAVWSTAELPVIMATARDESADVVEALRLGANDYVTKPLDFPVVLARSQTQVALRRSVRQAVDLGRQLAERNAELESANIDLSAAAERNRQELDLAARVQATYLPKVSYAPDRLRVAWRYEPCLGLAGDALNLCQLTPEHVALYVLDVSGHGVAAALTAVAAARLLAPGHDPDSILVKSDPAGGPPVVVPPADVMADLARRFAWNPDVAQFLTAFYAVLHTPTGKLSYASAGHPGPIVAGPGRPAQVLTATGMPVGVGELYDQVDLQLEPGDRLYIYSDGVTEAMTPDRHMFGCDRLAETLTRSAGTDIDAALGSLYGDLEAWRNGLPASDDVSVLAVEYI